MRGIIQNRAHKKANYQIVDDQKRKNGKCGRLEAYNISI